MCTMELALNVKIIKVRYHFKQTTKSTTSLVYLTLPAYIINFASSTMISSGDTMKRDAFDHDAVTHITQPKGVAQCGSFPRRALNYLDIYHIKRVLYSKCTARDA